jgi:hypothetical protein
MPALILITVYSLDSQTPSGLTSQANTSVTLLQATRIKQ